MVATISSYTQVVDEAAVHAAMADVALAMIDEIDIPFDADNALAAVARQPVALASAFGDVCALLGIRPPAFVRLALD